MENGGRPRTLVLCFDGTSEEYDKDNSNVVKFFSLLNKDPNDQLCYYDPGIGTWFQPGVVSPLFNWAAKILDLAFAWYVEGHVLDGYRFIMQNYHAGDKICLFGFSRGAYTARALAGFLHKIGLLPRDNVVQIPFAWKLYQREDKEGLELSEGFKSTFCQIVKVEFMGVWDTVASVGVVMGKTLPFTNSNSSITTFRHALALDERRARFRPSFYHRPSPIEVEAEGATEGQNPEQSTCNASSSASSSSSSSDKVDKPKAKPRRGFWSKKEEATSSQSKAASSGQDTLDDVLEIWFVGGHSDVGGGYTLNTDERSLSNITFRWMVREVMKSGCGVKFTSGAIPKLCLDTADELDAIDAPEKIHDILTGTFTERLWWILELLPLSYAWQDTDGVWHKSRGWHFGRGRDIYTPNPKFHHSVKTRMESSLTYKPKAKWEGTEEYVS